MIVVDSSVWIDHFNGAATREIEILDTLLGVEPIVIGGLGHRPHRAGALQALDFEAPAGAVGRSGPRLLDRAIAPSRSDFVFRRLYSALADRPPFRQTLARPSAHSSWCRNALPRRPASSSMMVGNHPALWRPERIPAFSDRAT